MTDKTDPRVAVLEAWWNHYQFDREPLQESLDDLDAADRAAGIVRVDTNDEALVERLSHVAGSAAAREFLAALAGDDQ